MSQTKRLRLDDLRHLASALLAASGLAPARASAMATHLLWYDQAGLPEHGLATLPNWLGRLVDGEVDPKVQGRVGPERTATAAFDGQGGVGPLLLARAAGLASEKAREIGVGIVRVRNLGATGPAAAVVAEVAIGPMVAVAIGPGPSWAMAVPSAAGLPAVFDSALAGAGSGPAPAWLWPLVVPEGEWLIQAVAVSALEPLTTLQERVASGLGSGEAPGLLRPEVWEARRREAREKGVALGAKSWHALEEWAARLEVALPGR